MSTSPSITLAIDFGTTKTLIAYADERGEPRILKMGRNADLIPTTAYLQEDGSLLFGDDADDMAEMNASCYCRAFKMKLGSTAPVLGHYTAQDLVREFLSHLVRRVKDDATLYKMKISGAVLTCPVNFSAAQKKQLTDAALASGLSEVKLITEPEAAGFAFCHFSGAQAFKNNALVVDWGGGTLDVALVSRSGEKINAQKRAAFGNNSMGGEVFDDRLSELVMEQLEGKTLPEHMSWQRFAQGVRNLKMVLSSAETGAFHQVTSGGLLSAQVKRADFEKSIHSDVSAAADAVKNLLSGLPESLQPEMLVLVGGTALIPCIRKELERVTGLPARTWNKARAAVVMGAALTTRPPEKAKAPEAPVKRPPTPTPTPYPPPPAQPVKPKEPYADEIEELLRNGVENWLAASAVRGEPGALENAASVMLKKTKDYILCAKWYRRAAVRGNVEAMAQLGTCHLCIIDDTPVAMLKQFHFTSAHKWLDDAIYLGSTKAKIVKMSAVRHLGVVENCGAYDWKCERNFNEEKMTPYIDEAGKIYEPAQAAAEYKKKAESGDASAARRMGLCYWLGYGVKKDLNAAAKWYSIALHKGDKRAGYELARLYLEQAAQTGSAELQRKGASLLEDACKAGVSGASAYRRAKMIKNWFRGLFNK